MSKFTSSVVSACGAYTNKHGEPPRITADTARENMKVFSRVLVAMIAAIAALFVGTGTSHAGLDNELSLVDGKVRLAAELRDDTVLIAPELR